MPLEMEHTMKATPISVSQLQSELAGKSPPLTIDVRTGYQTGW